MLNKMKAFVEYAPKQLMKLNLKVNFLAVTYVTNGFIPSPEQLITLRDSLTNTTDESSNDSVEKFLGSLLWLCPKCTEESNKKGKLCDILSHKSKDIDKK